MTVATRRRARVRVEGTVQGVGFRPYVYRLAGELELAGYVLNDAHGVLLEVEGSASDVGRFLERLDPEAPPLAVVDRIVCEERQPSGEHEFQILLSPRGQAPDAQVTPDTATCADCLRELFDPADRRYRYPFVNCTNCGPRFTIIQGIPYDRPLTTMASFTMCEACRAEYDDPADRRFHAQPNACPACGPRASLVDPGGGPAGVGRVNAVRAAAHALADGRIVAIKGMGGYHLACRADAETVVAALRARKHREDKPFALMVSAIEDAETLVRMGAAERELLQSRARPIVLLPRLPAGTVAAAVAPGAPELGLMLPYTPLHHLLLADFADSGGVGALVMTSGNVSDEPIAYRDADALADLGGIADLLLVHDRPIETRTDDSVVRVVGDAGSERRVTLRRSRGYVPSALRLPVETPRPLLACGAELKSTFCLARGGRAWVSHHVGDLSNYETLRSFTEGIDHFQRLFDVTPEVVVHDLHPEYLSTKYAFDRGDIELIGVQHHHAHLAAALADDGSAEPAVGAIFDGAGLGDDGAIWGGEILHGDLMGFQRLGSLLPVGLPGGEQAVRQPWRMAGAWLYAATGALPAEPPPGVAGHGVDGRRWRQVGELLGRGVQAPPTTSIGRLFDAVAALCGIRAEITYEGQAAVELEAACDPSARGAYAIDVSFAAGRLVIDPRQAMVEIAADVDRGVRPGIVASRFHAAVADAAVRACSEAAARAGTERVALGGGVFQNRRLIEAVIPALERAGLRVLVPQRVPLGDGAISYGQAAVGAARLAGGMAG